METTIHGSVGVQGTQGFQPSSAPQEGSHTQWKGRDLANLTKGDLKLLKSNLSKHEFKFVEAYSKAISNATNFGLLMKAGTDEGLRSMGKHEFRAFKMLSEKLQTMADKMEKAIAKEQKASLSVRQPASNPVGQNERQATRDIVGNITQKAVDLASRTGVLDTKQELKNLSQEYNDIAAKLPKGSIKTHDDYTNLNAAKACLGKIISTMQSVKSEGGKTSPYEKQIDRCLEQLEKLELIPDRRIDDLIRQKEEFLKNVDVSGDTKTYLKTFREAYNTYSLLNSFLKEEKERELKEVGDKNPKLESKLKQELYEINQFQAHVEKRLNDLNKMEKRHLK